jgi:hypothetical protein
MSGDDGMDFSTQVFIVRCVWTLVTISYRTRH